MSGTRIALYFAVTCAVAALLYTGLRFAGRIIGAPAPDLRFASFVKAEPAAPIIGEEATFSVMIENSGGGPAPRGIQVVAFASDPREGAAEIVTRGQLEEELAPGARGLVTMPYASPGEPQEVQLFFVIDPDLNLGESSRENNFLPATFAVRRPPTPRPDLLVEEIRFEPAIVRAEQDVSAVAVVRNVGRANTGAPTTLDFYVNDPIGPQPRLPGTRRLRVPPLSPNETVELPVRMRFRNSQLVSIQTQVDTDGEIVESDETNNIHDRVILTVGTPNPEGRPDLVVDRIEMEPLTPEVGQRGRLHVGLKNRGGADTDAVFAVAVRYQAPDGSPVGAPPTDEDAPYRSVDLRFLAAGQSFELPPIPIAFTHAGIWKVAVEIDPYKEVDEGEQEANNRAEIDVRVAMRR